MAICDVYQEETIKFSFKIVLCEFSNIDETKNMLHHVALPHWNIGQNKPQLQEAHLTNMV